MKDYIGRVLEVGDSVVVMVKLSFGHKLRRGIVRSFSKERVKIEYQNGKDSILSSFAPYNVVKV